jgi:hypothetical protein
MGMAKMFTSEWFQEQWEQIRGNAKWDGARWFWFIMTGIFGAVIAFVRAGPFWQVLTVVGLAVAAFIFYAFFDSKFGRTGRTICLIASILLLAIFAYQFSQSRQVKNTVAEPAINATTYGSNSPAFAAGRDMQVNISNAPIYAAVKQTTPVRDDAMHLVVDLREIKEKCVKEKWTQQQAVDYFRFNDHWRSNFFSVN